MLSEAKHLGVADTLCHGAEILRLRAQNDTGGRARNDTVAMACADDVERELTVS
jgi:hypothetical protein